MENLNLIRKLAWSFQKTTGIDYEELFSEASLAYCEALNDFDDNRNVKFTTYAYSRIQRHLINFSKYYQRRKMLSFDDIEFETGADFSPFWEVFETFSSQSQQIITRILQDPHSFLEKPAKYVRGDLKKQLRKEGWKWQDIYFCFREIKQSCN